VIDWFGVVTGALWIVGLATLLAVLSTAYWQSGATATPLRRVLGNPFVRRALIAGMVLFALGMLLGAEAWWEKGLWGVVIALAARDAVDTNATPSRR
jgi:hypothetical protein